MRAKTGRGWREWFALLDRAGAAKLDHRAIVAMVGRKMARADGWWQQTITVAYEQARGLRAVHQKPGGFEASASRTVALPVKRAFTAFADPRVRSKWLRQAALVVHRASPPKSIRATWKGAKSVSVYFYPKGADRTRIALQHGRLPDARSVARMKKYWAGRLIALERLPTP